MIIKEVELKISIVKEQTTEQYLYNEITYLSMTTFMYTRENISKYLTVYRSKQIIWLEKCSKNNITYHIKIQNNVINRI